jgi:hypothetical protein
MTRRQIQRFFLILSRELSTPATVIVTGAAAGSLWGHVRPSVDVDFAIRPRRRTAAGWADIERAIERTTRLTGIHANYAEDIDRWSSVTYLDYAHHTRPYRTFGRLQVRLLDPAYWSIGKIARGLALDTDDLVAVLARERVPVARLVRLWATAIRRSPRSPALTRCRQQAENFLRRHGRDVWGNQFDADRAVAAFRKALGGRLPASN